MPALPLSAQLHPASQRPSSLLRAGLFVAVPAVCGLQPVQRQNSYICLRGRRLLPGIVELAGGDSRADRLRLHAPTGLAAGPEPTREVDRGLLQIAAARPAPRWRRSTSRRWWTWCWCCWSSSDYGPGVAVRHRCFRAQNANREGNHRAAPGAHIDKSQQVFLGDQVVNIHDIAERLRQQGTDPAHQVIYLRADESVPFGVFATLMDGGETSRHHERLYCDPTAGSQSSPSRRPMNSPQETIQIEIVS